MNDFQVMSADAEYSMFGNAHNIVANEETGFVYVVGATAGFNTTYPNNCMGMLTCTRDIYTHI